MARCLTAAAVALLVLVSLVASATSETPKCCTDNHRWGNDQEEKSHCEPQDNDDCNSWCVQADCGMDKVHGFCKKIGNLHYCHCRC